MTRTPEQAIAWTHQRGLIPDESGRPVGAAGWCKRETRSAYGVPSDGSKDAAEAFRRTQRRHSTATVPPRGAVMWWTGGRNGHGHVAISLGDGTIRTTDLPTSGRWGTVTRTRPVTDWGLTYVGWSEDIDGVRVFVPPRKPSRLANLRKRLLAVANDPKVGPVRRRAARRAAAALKGLK